MTGYTLRRFKFVDSDQVEPHTFNELFFHLDHAPKCVLKHINVLHENKTMFSKWVHAENIVLF